MAVMVCKVQQGFSISSHFKTVLQACSSRSLPRDSKVPSAATTASVLQDNLSEISPFPDFCRGLHFLKRFVLNFA